MERAFKHKDNALRTHIIKKNPFPFMRQEPRKKVEVFFSRSWRLHVLEAHVVYRPVRGVFNVNYFRRVFSVKILGNCEAAVEHEKANYYHAENEVHNQESESHPSRLFRNHALMFVFPSFKFIRPFSKSFKSILAAAFVSGFPPFRSLFFPEAIFSSNSSPSRAEPTP